METSIFIFLSDASAVHRDSDLPKSTNPELLDPFKATTVQGNAEVLSTEILALADQGSFAICSRPSLFRPLALSFERGANFRTVKGNLCDGGASTSLTASLGCVIQKAEWTVSPVYHLKAFQEMGY